MKPDKPRANDLNRKKRSARTNGEGRVCRTTTAPLTNTNVVPFKLKVRETKLFFVLF